MPPVPTTSPEYFDPPDLSRLPNVGNAPLPANADPSAARALMQNFASGVAPAAAGVGAFEPGAAVGAGIGAFAGLGVADEVTVPLFSLIGGTITSGLASAGTAKVQQVGADALTGGGYSATLAADQAAHPYASFAGDLASQLPFMRPSMSWAVKARAAGAGIGGGIEAGREYVNDNGQLDPYRIGMATGFGAALDHNTGFGDAVMAPGRALISRITTGPGATMARIGADDVVDNSVAELNLDPAAIAQRADAIGETHPNLSPATRMGYARAEAVTDAAGAHATPDETAARNVIEGDAQVEASNPFTGPNAAQDHGERLAVATQSLLAGVPMPDMNAPLQAPMPPIATADLHAAVLHVESHGDAGAISPKGARGLMQVMPGTQGDPGYGVAPLPPNATPDQVRAQGDAYLDAMVAHYGGDQTLGIAAYNGGPGNVDHWLKTIGDPRAGGITDAQFADRIPVPETRDYVKKVYAAAGHDIPQSPIVSPDALAAAGPDVADPPASAEQYVDRYLAGAGRGDSPADLEMQQFAANNGPDIQAEFNRRVANPDFQPVETPPAQGGVTRREAASTPTGGPQANAEPVFDPTPPIAPEGTRAIQLPKVGNGDMGAGDLWRATPEQLERMLAEKSEGDDAKLVRALGEQGAKDFKRLDRAQNSQDIRRADAAGKEFDAKFGDLTPEQERLVYGIGETDAQVDDIKEVLKAHSDIMASDDADWAAYVAGIGFRHAPLEDIAAVPEGKSTAVAQASFVRLTKAYDAMTEQGIDPNEIPKRMAQAMAARGVSPEHAGELVQSFVDKMRAMAPGGENPEAGRGIVAGQHEQLRLPSAVDPGQPEPRLKAFDEPIGKGVAGQADAIEHDLRMTIDPDAAAGQAADQPEFRLDAEGAQTSIKDVLDQIDSEKNAVDELRGCIKPVKGAS